MWAGEARVTLQVEITGTYKIELSTFDNQADTLENYEIRLMDVAPYPEIPNELSQEDYSVLLEITRLN